MIGACQLTGLKVSFRRKCHPGSDWTLFGCRLASRAACVATLFLVFFCALSCYSEDVLVSAFFF